MATEPITPNPQTLNAPPNLALTSQEEKTVQTDPQEWKDDFALKVAVRDFQIAEAYRSANHDRRFREAEKLLTGWVEKKFWEGTKVQRSSVPVFIALQEIEVLQSRLIDSIFGEDPPFAATPQPGTTLAQAFAVRNLLASQLRDLGKPGQFLTVREVFRRANKSALTYGAGIPEMGWFLQEVNRNVYYRHAVAETTDVINPQTGETQQFPTGKLKMVSSMRQDKRVISRPLVQNIDTRDFYWEPDCPSPNPQEARYTVTRHMLTIEEIKSIASNPESGFKLPDDKALQNLATKKFYTQGDQSKQTAEAYRGNTYTPTMNKSVDPALAKIEVLRYWRPNRHVEVLGREWTFFNECNPYGIIPHLNVFYIDMLGRFLGYSIPDLVEGDHKLAMSILNDRIDELNIILHPPIIRKRGAMMGTSGKRFHPGASWEVQDNPREDIVRMEMGAVNPQAFAEISAIDQRVQKLTGNTDAAAYGVATAGGDSSGRTATGIQSKQVAASGRIGYQVSNLEDQVLEPFLYILLALNKIYLDPSQVQQILGPDAQLFELDPLDVLNADVHFKVTASQRMKTKQNLQSGGINFILTSYLNPAFQAQANMIGMTADLKNIDQLVSDAYDLPAMTLMRQMTPQEQQSLQQQHQAEMMMKMQMQTERLQSNQTINAEKDDTKVLAAALAKVLTPEAVHALFQSAFGMKHPTEVAEAAKAKHNPPKALKG